MTLDEYQEKAMRTAMDFEQEEDALSYAAMAVAGEAGEYMNIVKKQVYHGHEAGQEAIDAMADELGDIQWGVAYAAWILGIPLSVIASKNLEKLQKRYPDGFDPERSRNRNL